MQRVPSEVLRMPYGLDATTAHTRAPLVHAPPNLANYANPGASPGAYRRTQAVVAGKGICNDSRANQAPVRPPTGSHPPCILHVVERVVEHRAWLPCMCDYARLKIFPRHISRTRSPPVDLYGNRVSPAAACQVVMRKIQSPSRIHRQGDAWV